MEMYFFVLLSQEKCREAHLAFSVSLFLSSLLVVVHHFMNTKRHDILFGLQAFFLFRLRISSTISLFRGVFINDYKQEFWQPEWSDFMGNANT